MDVACARTAALRSAVQLSSDAVQLGSPAPNPRDTVGRRVVIATDGATYAGARTVRNGVTASPAALRAKTTVATTSMGRMSQASASTPAIGATTMMIARLSE